MLHTEYIPTKKFNHRPGLYFENGTVMLEGKPFRGIGVNYFGAFLNEFYHPEKGELRQVLKLLRDHDIRYFRANMGMFWPVDYQSMFDNPERYRSVMDKVVATAEEFGLGIIPCLFWHPAGISDYFGEHRGAFGKAGSKTSRFIQDYTMWFISRYKESPAMWMWEFSNELNLSLDLPNRAELRAAYRAPLQMGAKSTLEKEDDLFSDSAVTVLSEFAELCRTYDIYGRMITSGCSEPRPTQYQQRVFDIWSDRPDSFEEMKKTLEWHNPAPMDCISIHTYDLLPRFPGTETYRNTLRAFRDAGAQLNRALFVGEFHGLQIDKAKEIIHAVIAEEIPLSAVWAVGKVEYSLDNDPGIRSELLTYIKEANQKLADKIAVF